MKSAVLVAVAALCLSSSGAFAGCSTGMGTLYDQNTNWGSAVPSSNFGGTVYDSAAVDDFVVPSTAGEWWLCEIDVTGAYVDGSSAAQSVTVTFYKDRRGKPGPILGNGYDTFVIACTDTNGSFACPLPFKKGHNLAVRVRAGHRYWVSVVANCTGSCTGWGWTENTIVQNDPAMWENPGNGYATGCAAWQQLASCGFGSADFAFSLKGID